MYSKPPFGGPEQVLKYLARYTHRVAIANSRITAADSDSVSFPWPASAAGGHSSDRLLLIMGPPRIWEPGRHEPLRGKRLGAEQIPITCCHLPVVSYHEGDESWSYPSGPMPHPGSSKRWGNGSFRPTKAHLNDQRCSRGLLHRSTATARHMIAWLTINESEVATLDIRGVYRFLRHDCHCPADVRNQSTAPSPWHAHRFLGYLLETGQAAVPASIVTGGGLVEAFAVTLVAQGYREATVRGVRSSCRHLVVWLYRSELALGAIEDRVLQRFLDHRCDCEHPGFFGRSGRSSAFAGSRRTQAEIARFASFLIDRDVVADWRDPLPKVSGGAHTDAFLRWLRQHRGARDTTLKAYRQSLQALLPLLGDAPGAYDAASIRAVILGRAQSGSRNTAEGSALRSYLRFLAAQGLRRPGLVAAVPFDPASDRLATVFAAKRRRLYRRCCLKTKHDWAACRPLSARWHGTTWALCAHAH